MVPGRVEGFNSDGAAWSVQEGQKGLFLCCNYLCSSTLNYNRRGGGKLDKHGGGGKRRDSVPVTHPVKSLILQPSPEGLSDPREALDGFLPHGLGHKVPVFL